MAGLDAVCFDLDGTLCVRDRDDEAIHEQVFDRAGLEPVWAVENIYEVDHESLPPADTPAEWWEAFYRAVAAETGTDPTHAPALADATVEIVVDDPRVVFRAGAEAALEAARERAAVGLVTHGSERAQRAKLARLGIADAFGASVFCGPTEACPGKPDPEPFRRATEALGASPERTVYVGNRLEGDVGGANAAGMVSVWVSDGGEPDESEPEPDHVLASMGELPDLVEGLDSA